ncbi:MAG: uracil phosphoribosyltransferase [Armatimonadetes bacterium]|nr:uracil phosphoribosyltransferase [Armatimonadota bacterium]MBS1711566.1 uracil phosphoribosyltransferase [Armatimonadota bacterium]MBX3109879.1 uracil phosphoribosyltransferase [Fimbriimonadaceae bacterium]
MPVHVSTHPLAHHLLADLRDTGTDPHAFRRAARVLGTILALEATQTLPNRATKVQTPLEQTDAIVLGAPLAVVPILRAGLSMLEPFLELFPDVAVGYIGLERNEETAEASSYYCKLPRLDGTVAIVVDPMLATGGSASQAIGLVKQGNPRTVTLVSVVAAPEGVARMAADHPDVEVFVAALDRGLNEKKYILPGLGDYGDRLFGTL